MKFSSSFSAIVVASVATAQLSAAAPVGARGIIQGSTQGTTQQGTGAVVSQSNSSDQHNSQGVKVAKDDSLFLNSPVTSDAPSFAPAPPVVAPGPAVPPKAAAPPAPAPAPQAPAAPVNFNSKTGDLVKIGILDNNKANAEVAGTGNQGNARRSSTGDLIDLGALNQNAANVGALATGNQGNIYKNAGSAVPHGDGETGDLIDAGLINYNKANAEVLGTGEQGNLYSRQLLGLLGNQGAKQEGSADGAGGNSLQGQLNRPILSGASNSLTAGGPENAANNGQGGGITQGLKQVEDLGGLLRKRLLGAQGGKQGASANGAGGNSLQGALNNPVLSGAGNSLTAGGPQSSQNDGAGGQIEQGLKQIQDLDGLLRKRLLGAQGGKQGASANGYGGNSGQLQGNLPVLSGAGNSLTAGGPQGATNDGTGGSIEQGLKQVEDLGGLLKKRLLGSQGAKQGASANGYGGHSGQLQGNLPVLSGYSNSLTAGGPQGAENNGQGGSVAQTLKQLQDLDGLLKRQYFAAGHQFGSADGFGGHSIQGQSNVPVVSGYGNSVTAGGPQEGENNGYGGGVQQTLAEGLGLRQLGALGFEGGRADGYGGQSFQYQSNRPVVSGYGNSVTAGGPQGATNNGQGGTVGQGLKELFARQYQGLGQGIGQGIHQYGSAQAEGGNAFVSGANGPTFINTGAKGGVVNQYANGQQADGQSGTQGLEQARYDSFYGPGYFRRQLQGLGQSAGQGIDQVGSAAAHGGSAYVAGSTGPTYIKTGAQGGVVNQNGEANQQDAQSGTQGLGEGFYNYFAARDLQSLGQSTSQETKQVGSADAAGGPAWLVGSNGPTVVDTSSRAGAVTQGATSNQQDSQKAGQSDEHLFYNGWYRRGHNEQLSQSNAQNINTNADASAHSAAANLAYLKDAGVWTHDPTSFDPALSGAKAGDISQIVGASQGTVQKGSQYGKRFIPYVETGNADALGGSSLDFQHNGKVVEGNGINSVQGGAQSENGSSQGGSLSQLLNL